MRLSFDKLLYQTTHSLKNNKPSLHPTPYNFHLKPYTLNPDLLIRIGFIIAANIHCY